MVLPNPIQKIICTYATLCDPEHPVHIIQLRSIEVYNIRNQRIFYIQELKGVASLVPGWSHVHRQNSSSLSSPYVLAVVTDPNDMAGRGYNTFHGFDTGPPPPGFPPSQANGLSYAAILPQLQTFAGPQLTFPPAASIPIAVPTLANQPGNHGFYPAGWCSHTHPAPAPATNSMFPGVHLRNHTGGVGLPPGYDYVFPTEHTTIHVFKTGPTPPWRQTLWSGDASNHAKLFVPCTSTVKELMQNLGCTNSDAKKNKLHELQEAGNGRWVKGITISGDEKDKLKKSIAEFGWDKSRTGAPGARPVVWLWCTKD